MATTLYPQNGDLGDELAFQGTFKTGYNHVQERTFQIASYSGLDVTIQPGQFFIDGVRGVIDSQVTLSIPDNTEAIVSLKVARSGGLVQDPASDADNFDIWHAGLGTTYTIGDRCPLFLIRTSGGSITDIIDARIFNRSGVKHRQPQTTDGTNTDQEARTGTSLAKSRFFRMPSVPFTLPSYTPQIGGIDYRPFTVTTFRFLLTSSPSALGDCGVKFQLDDAWFPGFSRVNTASLVAWGEEQDTIQTDDKSPSFSRPFVLSVPAADIPSPTAYMWFRLVVKIVHQDSSGASTVRTEVPSAVDVQWAKETDTTDDLYLRHYDFDATTWPGDSYFEEVGSVKTA